MSELPPRVFLSAGTKQSKEQEQFITALQVLLSNAGFEVRRAQWSAINPLAKIKEEMNGCDGTVMVAFERIYTKEGRERSSSTKFTRITDQRFTTVWNHVEAAMAYCLELPLFIIGEPNLREEGLLEKFDWYIHRTQLSANTAREPEFLGIFQDWADRVRAHHRTKLSPANVGRRDQSRDLLTVDLPKLFAFAAAIGVLIVGAFIAGSKWPGLAEVIKAMTPS
ncbi:MAG TPA: hypothetical protein VMS19_04760 [Methyloceanibacter sp.]|nr:hypothetical protein [Methyloceanibacter sp.]